MNVTRYAPVLVFTFGALLSGCGPSADKPKQGKSERPTVVQSSVVKIGELPQQISTNGHVEAVQMIEIRPQVSAQIAAIHFKEGDEVKAGQLLFTLDARNDEAQANRSKAVAAQMEAQLAEADRNLARTIELAQAKFISPSAVDTARAKAESLRAQLVAAKADQTAAAVKLSYTRIVAPFAGRTGKINIRTGALAQTNSTEPLVTLTQLDPVRISFNVPERDLSALIAAQHNTSLAVQATLPDGSTREGKLVFLDSAVDKNTGTLLAKAEFANADRQLWPGLSVGIEVQLGAEKGLIVPLQAIQTGPEQRFVYVIGEDKKAQAQNITVLRSHDGQALVEGLKPGSKVIREGGQNVRPGGMVIEASKPAKKSASQASHSGEAQ
ncbi:efflux RND transporter periplasmic adaptor subunit [Chitinibacter fontanus]|uniref:Efflux RND transporter periplasmic adaptor subunit n=1 Tax=Chitinibacter fontanus TaxID=1737446 RepID=A0A7D5V9F1_9NEIS|nr:efflux RND transporter periplasmic adaptor subunit [Chitinibacter fontanus]QLI80900.1 efflux RND transporter periplasmic adaptor subunit [Chitinibacter fontanus]